VLSEYAKVDSASMTTKVMTFRFPEELAEEIVSRSKVTGRDRTAVVVEALSEAFNLSIPVSSSVESLQQQLNQLEATVTDLAEQITELRQSIKSDSK
jgi:predicted ATP-grasp superfamily ATP-dependent carboligase